MNVSISDGSSWKLDSHCMNFEGFQLAVTKAVDPRYWSKAEVDDQVENVITVDLRTVSVMLFIPFISQKFLQMKQGECR